MSQYLEALRQAMVIYPMIVVLFTVPYIAWSYHKYGFKNFIIYAVRSCSYR